MKLNHVNVPVTDVDAAKEFLEQYFDFQYLGGDGMVAVLEGEDDTIIGLSPVDSEDDVPDSIHIGFFVDNRETVDEMHHLLETEGYHVGSVHERHHTYDFYVWAPGELTIEVGSPIHE